MKYVMLSLNVHYSVTNVLLLHLMSENAPYTGLYIGPLLNVCPGALLIECVWIFDTLSRPSDAFCMSLYCQKEKWAILTPSTLPYPLGCLNLQAQCFRTCHCAIFTSQDILGLSPLTLHPFLNQTYPKNAKHTQIWHMFDISQPLRHQKNCQKVSKDAYILSTNDPGKL